MTESVSEGQVTAEPTALVPEGMPLVHPKPDDPLNAAIAATAGEAVAEPAPPRSEPSSLAQSPSPWASASDDDRATAQEGHIKAGVGKAMASVGNAEIVTVAAFKAGIEALLRHLHFDHPENYLPKG